MTDTDIRFAAIDFDCLKCSESEYLCKCPEIAAAVVEQVNQEGLEKSRALAAGEIVEPELTDPEPVAPEAAPAAAEPAPEPAPVVAPVVLSRGASVLYTSRKGRTNTYLVIGASEPSGRRPRRLRLEALNWDARFWVDASACRLAPPVVEAAPVVVAEPAPVVEAAPAPTAETPCGHAECFKGVFGVEFCTEHEPKPVIAPTAAQLMEAAVAVGRIPQLLSTWVFAALLSGAFHALGRWASSAAPVEAEPETIETSLTNIAAEGQRLAQVQARSSYTYQAPRFSSALPAVETAAPLLRSQDFIAGAAAAGHGLLVGWNGLGELTRADLAAVLADAECPSDWLPSIPSATKHAGDAIRGLQNYGYVVRRVRAKATGAARRKAGVAWKVGSVGGLGQNEGDSFGKLTITFTLVGDQLTHSGDEGLAAQVLAEYTRTTANEIYKAGQITQWLGDILRSRCNGVKTGIGYYIPRNGIDACRRLVVAIASRWGSGFWPNGGLPVATSAELRRGIADGLGDEVSEIARDLENYKANRAEKGVGERAATNYIVRLSAIADRVKAYADVLGAELVVDVKERADAFIAELSQFSSDTARRGALIWEDIARDAAIDAARDAE